MTTVPNDRELIPIRWEHPEKKRYYQLFLSRDLLGDWVVTKAYGGLNTSVGRVTHVACSSLEDAKKLMSHIAQIRFKRGYVSI